LKFQYTKPGEISFQKAETKFPRNMIEGFTVSNGQKKLKNYTGKMILKGKVNGSVVYEQEMPITVEVAEDTSVRDYRNVYIIPAVMLLIAAAFAIGRFTKNQKAQK
jgi:UPF0288 family protein (methanogenesis marker protein 3)